MSAPGRTSEAERLTATIAGAVVFGYVVSLALKYFGYAWIVDAHGRPVLEDFVTLWAAGKSALGGMALDAYDSHAQHAAESATVGRGFVGLLGAALPAGISVCGLRLRAFPTRGRSCSGCWARWVFMRARSRRSCVAVLLFWWPVRRLGW